MTLYNVAASISYTANAHVGKDDAAAFRTIFFMSDTIGVYPSWKMKQNDIIHLKFNDTESRQYRIVHCVFERSTMGFKRP